jgi:hypothetical protein
MYNHRVHIECQAFSPVVRIGSPRPSPASECCPPPLVPRGGAHLQASVAPSFGSKGGEAHLLAGEGAGGVNSDEGTEALIL